MKKFLLFLLMLGVSFGGTKLLRTPHISGDKIVFSYQGDIWIAPVKGGEAHKLTSSPGYEAYPRFSPDGKYVAFSGQYYGGRDVYVVPSRGGDPIKLTYHSSYEMVVGWTPDGRVVFTSDRETIFPTVTRFYAIGLNESFPEALPIDRGSFIDFSPDGRYIAFNRNSGYFWWWKRYKGSANLDVWLLDKETGKFSRLTKWEGNDAWPMFGKDGKIYFVSDRDGISNLYSMDFKAAVPAKTIKKLTNFSGAGVQWPSISVERDRIAFERDGDLYVYYIGTGKLQKLNITASGDLPFNMREVYNPKKLIQNFDVSPSGKRVVIIARGEVFSVPAKHGPTRNLSKTYAREEWASWAPDGKHIAYFSDEDGEFQLYIVNEKTGKKEKLTGILKFKYNPLWSPDSRKIAFATNDGKIYILYLEKKKLQLVDTNPMGPVTDYSWSPDSRWLAYVLQNKIGTGDIYVFNTETKKKYPLITSTFDDYNPRFTTDGKRLVYLSRDVIRPRFDFFAEALTVSTGVKIMSLDLVPGLENIYEPKPDEEEVEKKEGKKETPARKAKKKSKEKKIRVKIDFSNLKARIRPVPVRPGDYYGLNVTKDYYLFVDTKTRTLMGYRIKKRKTEPLVKGIGSYALSARGTHIAYMKGKKIAIARVGKVAKDQFVPLDDMTMELNRKAEWRQIFNEAWRMVRDFFYDKNLHGVNWKAVKKKYEKLLPYVRTRQELNTLIEEMVGELNASHQGARGGDYGVKLPNYQVGYIGASFEPDFTKGLYRIKHIYAHDPDVSAYHNPLYGKVREGEYILSIDGVKVSTSRNIYSYLVGKAKKEIEILISPDGTMAKARKLLIKTIPYEGTLIYHDWVVRNRKYVDKMSGGKIGYIHLRDMMFFGMGQFLRWINAYRYKDAIIIDVRFNGGGGIDPYLIDILERRPYQTVRGRDQLALERPMGGFYGHVAVLINQFSYSDAEVFPAAFKARKLGTLIGVPTLGFVIAVTSHPMIDGGIVRRTSWGLWELTGEMLEGKGATPDIYVDNPPEAVLAGKDPQLDRAIEVLLKKIKEQPRKKYPRHYFKKH